MGMSPAASAAGGGRRRKSRRHTLMAEINVTPFVDVMLVLLIIFMVAAPLLTVGIPVDLPTAKAEPVPTDTQPLSVTISPDGKIMLQDAEVTPNELAAKVKAIVANDPEKRILLRAYKNADYGTIAQVLSRVKEAGATKFTLQTKALEETGS